MSHFAEKYIGIPYIKGGVTTNGFDCWGLFRHIQKEVYDLDLPTIEVDSSSILKVAKEIKDGDEKKNWIKIDKPVEGCAVLLAHAKYPSHVGVWLDVDKGGVLHCVKGMGVIFSSLNSLKLASWGRIEFYEHNSRHKSI